MKVLLISALFLAFNPFAYADCDGKGKDKAKANHQSLDLEASGELVHLSVERMRCGSCQAKIKAALEKIDGIVAVDFDMVAKTVKVESSQPVGTGVLVAAVNEAGFSVDEVVIK